MRKTAGRAVGCVLLIAAAVSAGDAPTLPSWLAPFPGARERSGSMTGRAWSDYLTKASLDEVIAFYRGMFDARRLAFHPVQNSMTTTIRGAAEECSLEITLQQMTSGTSVRIMCSAWASGPNKPLDTQAKYDRPVYPKAKPAVPRLAWPDWLTTCDPAATPEIVSGTDQFELRYMKAEFNTLQDRESIQDFYADLLNAHDYPVWIRSSKITPKDRAVVVEGQHYFGEKPGPRFAIHVESKPVSSGMHVEIRITAHPM